MSRPRERIVVETQDGVFDAFQSLELRHDFDEVQTLTFSFGNDGTLRDIGDRIRHGKRVRVTYNDLIQFTGRFESIVAPKDAHQGEVVHVIARARTSDARYGSASPKLAYKDVTLRKFIASAYAQWFKDDDFEWDAATERHLLTGEAKGKPKPADVEAINEAKAKVNPPETTYQVVDKHLLRNHLKHWDSGSGRIVVGKPDDTQAPLTRLVERRGAEAVHNNILSRERITDWSEVPLTVNVFGTVQTEDGETKQIRGTAFDKDLLEVSGTFKSAFGRDVHIPIDDGARTQARAVSQAKRELANRSKDKDAWKFTTDGWGYWNGSRLIPWAINTTTDVDVDAVDARAVGRYLIYRLVRTLDNERSAMTSIEVAAPGILVL